MYQIDSGFVSDMWNAYLDLLMYFTFVVEYIELSRKQLIVKIYHNTQKNNTKSLLDKVYDE